MMVRQLKRPWLIQRCELGEGQLKYDYKGSSEFEVGDQAKSLKRIFAEGIYFESLRVDVGCWSVGVFVLAGKGFPFAEYQPYLQQLANDELNLQELSYFDSAIKARLGMHPRFIHIRGTNVWFDFQNDVLWTLTEDKQRVLVSVLEGIKNKWAEKK
ncbi:MAG: hypothetical protein HZA36_00230 [Parcubacteria group bacterium]|nr:hypothetical protein [Parcubacteria group bacterium]